MIELLACQFCGMADDLEKQIGTTGREGVPVNIVCGHCGANGPWSYADPSSDKDQWDRAIHNWNRRAS